MNSPLSVFPSLSLSVSSGFFRFCVGDKFFLKNNMILCQTDYEEGLMKEGYAPQVRWPLHDTFACRERAERGPGRGQTPKALPSSSALILDNVHKKCPLRGTTVQNSHRDLLWVGKGVLKALLSKMKLVLDIAVAHLKQSFFSPAPKTHGLMETIHPKTWHLAHLYTHQILQKK